MKIGCDIDGTCVDFSNKFTTWMASHQGKYILNKDVAEHFPMYKHYEQNNTEECFDLSLYENCVNVLKAFHDSGHSITFITKRGTGTSTPEKAKEIIDLTTKWKGKYFPWAQDIIFTEEKQLYAQNKEIDVMIEDDAGNANQIAQHCPVILISRSWNRHIGLHENVIVAENWIEVAIILNNLEKYRATA